MTKFKIIQGGREQMGREALSAAITGDDAKLEELIRIMQPLNPLLAVIACVGKKDTAHEQPSIEGES
jgi:hypothetical protein